MEKKRRIIYHIAKGSVVMGVKLKLLITEDNSKVL